jgi:hypothetical protein
LASLSTSATIWLSARSDADSILPPSARVSPKALALPSGFAVSPFSRRVAFVLAASVPLGMISLLEIGPSGCRRATLVLLRGNVIGEMRFS